MTGEEAEEFVSYVDGAWAPPSLTDVQRELWRRLCEPLDTKAAFTVLTRMFKTEERRPTPPVFQEAYKRELIDTTPAYVQPEDRYEMPLWARGWQIARAEGDFRLWPEQERGYRELHELWIEEIGEQFVRRHGLVSGYEWPAALKQFGMMPQAERLGFMARAENGEGPRSVAETVSARSDQDREEFGER